MKNNATTKKLALEWFKAMDNNTSQIYYLKYEHLIGKDRLVTDDIKEHIYLSEHPQDISTDTLVVEGLEDAANEAAGGLTDSGTPYERTYFIQGYKEGAQWHKEQVMQPLVESNKELLEALKLITTEYKICLKLLSEASGMVTDGINNVTISAQKIINNAEKLTP